jgi:Mg2+ and Co2+ transporter CorA
MQGCSEADLDFICEELQIPPYMIDRKAIEESFPHIDYFRNYTTIFLWDTRQVVSEREIDRIAIEKRGFLVLCANENIVTMFPGTSDLFDQVREEGIGIPNESFTVRVLHAVLKSKLRDCAEIIRPLEHRTADLEDVPVGKAPARFLEETFHLKKEVQKLIYNLLHFRQLLNAIRTHRVALAGLREESLDLFTILHDEAEYLLDTLQNVKESVISLIELHINAASFDMNRVMRVLAVITALSVIPAVIGGLLGENLSDQPYPLTIFEIALIVATLMFLGLFAFWRKGWLR